MSFTGKAAIFTLALLLPIAWCYPVQAQDPPPSSTAPAAPQDVPPPKPGQVVRPWQPGDPEPKGPMQIVVIEGQDGVNILKKKTAVSPVVEVRDGRNSPLAGVAVNFSSPTDGPSLTFSNGLRSISVITDATGRATADDLTPLGLGAFELTAAASYRSLSASATIPMTNVQKALPKEGATGAAHGSGMSGKTIGILVGVAAAAAVGIGVGLGGHSSSSSTSSSGTTATIGAGSGGSVGAPH